MSNNIVDENNLTPNINDMDVAKEHNSLAKNSPDTVSYKTSLENDECTCSLHSKKITDIKNCLHKDIHRCDFTWSLFQSAMNSYRFDSCLRPFPPMFYSNGFKDITRMRNLASQVPDMYKLIDVLDIKKYPQDLINLLHWVLVNPKDPYLKLLIHEDFRPDLTNMLHYISDKQLPIAPNFVFKMVYSNEREKQFEIRKANKSASIFAFHGSRLDNFYSILKFGLQQHLSCNETLFGAGIYLSNELMLSLSYAPCGTAWEKSNFGSNYSIVALCEIINDTENVKCQDVADKQRSVSPGSIGGTVPKNYYVVLNNELVRVRYLLVFKQTLPINSMLVKRSKMYEFFVKHKMIILLALYSLLLCLIGFANSSYWFKLRRIIKNYFEEDFL